MACIDALSLTLIKRLYPELVSGLHEIGSGPLVPSPPVIVPAATPSALVDSLRDAFTWALSDRDRGRLPRAELCIDGFVALDNAEYATHASARRRLTPHWTGTSTTATEQVMSERSYR